MAKSKKANQSNKAGKDSTPATVMIRYVGRAQGATRIGEKTKKIYKFKRDKSRTPLATRVQKEDVPYLLAETGMGCFRRAPESLFVLNDEFDETHCN